MATRRRKSIKRKSKYAYLRDKLRRAQKADMKEYWSDRFQAYKESRKKSRSKRRRY